MFFALTTAGKAALASSATPPVLTLFRCGSSFGYTPSGEEVSIQGSSVASGVPSQGVVQSANLLKYTVHLDATLGDFYFGEVGLYLPGNILFAIGSASAPINKTKNNGTHQGNDLAIDCYVSTVGSNFAIYAELGNSASELSLQAVSNIDALPRAVGAYPNIFQASSPDRNGSVLAFSNNALWSISGYEEIIDEQYVTGATVTSCSVGSDSYAPAFPGELVVQWTTGKLLGVCRIVAGYSSGSRTFVFDTPLSELPSSNDKLQVMKKTALRPHVAELLAGLDTQLTAGDLNSLLTNPLNGFVRRNGSTPMLAPFDAGGLRIKNVAVPVLGSDSANKEYVDSTLGSSSALINSLNQAVATVSQGYFRKDGTLAMTGVLNFGGYRGTNVATPLAPNDVVNKGYVDLVSESLTSSIISNHSDLSGLQGGTAGQHYHLTAVEHAFVANLVGTGYPIAGYGQPGITAFATNDSTGSGLVNNEAITPESLYLALTNVGTPNALQSAIIQASNQFQSFVQFGSGAPTGSVPATPPFYCDVSTIPYKLYVYRAGAWRTITTQVVQFGSGAPTPATQVEPPRYLDITTFPLTEYAYYSGNWMKVGGPYTQFGTGAPTPSTPTEPSIYFDVASAPMKMYAYRSGVWTQSGADSVVPKHTKLYFFSQI